MTLFRSLREHCPAFRLHVLCLDRETCASIRQLGREDLVPIPLEAIESWDPDLTATKPTRSAIEYYFTMSPVLPLYVLDRNPAIDVITYLDADLFFYSDPAPIFSEFGEHSILMTAHRFPEHLTYMEQKGRFNVQFLSFRRNVQGLACLNRWRAQCIDWCYDRISGDRYADQKYLDEWPHRYDDLVVLEHPGSALGPWNWSSAALSLAGDTAFVDGVPLVFYHFHGIKILHPNLISLGMYRYGKMPREMRRWFYGGYTRRLKETARWLESAGLDRYGLHYRDVRGGRSFLRTLVESLASGQLMIVR
jgi:hypothetical protein